MTRGDKQRADHEQQRQRLLQQLRNCDRRTFLSLAGRYAAMTVATGVVAPHSFQLVEFVYAATPETKPEVAFRLAYISDTHLFSKGMTHRFAKAALTAVEDVNALDPQPDFVLFGGDLAQLGQADELALGQQILKEVKAPLKVMVGEHDWYFDLGEKWRELFGQPTYSWDHKGVHFVVLNSVVEKDFWTAKGMTPMQRMVTVAGLDNARQSRFEVGAEQRNWLAKDLAKVDKKTPLVVFSHSPLYKYYRDWNFWTDDAEDVQKLLFPFAKVTVIHGHTHQLLTNRIKNISFHGMLSTAWPWPYAPSGLPKLTIQMDRTDPFDQFDGCGNGTIDVRKDGPVNKNYALWSRNPLTVAYDTISASKAAAKGPSY